MISRTIFSRTIFSVAATFLLPASEARQQIDPDFEGTEALHLLQTQVRPSIHHLSRGTIDAIHEEEDPIDESLFDEELAGPRADAPKGAVRADYEVQGQSPQTTQNLRFHKMKYRNLGGLGPHTSQPANVRYMNVAKTLDGTPVDLILESDNFKTAKPKKVGLYGASAVVNIQNGHTVDFTARFVDKDGNSVTMGPFHMSVMDIDTGKEGGQEELTIGGFSSSYMLDETELTKVEMADGRTKFIAGLPGTGADNPVDPIMLTDVQAKRTVSFQFPGGLDSFSFSYKVAKVAYDDYEAELDGRHFFLSGMSSLYFCEAEPVVVDYNMATVAYSNLGGLGPDFDSPPALRFNRIAHIENDEKLDMVVTNLTSYEPANNENNGLNGQFAQINIGGGTSTKFRFNFVKHGTDEPVKMDWAYMSIYDLDHGKVKSKYKETVEIKGFVTHYLTETSELELTQHGDKWYTYASTTWGTGADNPSDPMTLSQQQKDRSVTILFHDVSSFDAKFAAAKPKNQGRNFLFSGKSALVFC
jgi:hypothetical protein